jgi:hypothetical protein
MCIHSTTQGNKVSKRTTPNLGLSEVLHLRVTPELLKAIKRHSTANSRNDGQTVRHMVLNQLRSEKYIK